MIDPSPPTPQTMPLQESDFEPMRAALEQARLALAEGNLPIGAVIVHDDQIVATGRNGVDSGENDTHHAELAAIQSIPQFLFRHKRQCTVYTTLEPCMMCMGTIVIAGIHRIVWGASDPVAGVADMLPRYTYLKRKQVDLVSGVLAEESLSLLDEYWCRRGVHRERAIQALLQEVAVPAPHAL
jgi:tRNA(adenine34) deaminase